MSIRLLHTVGKTYVDETLVDVVQQFEEEPMTQRNIPPLPYIIGILNNPYRLKLIGLLATQAHSLEELSSSLHVKAALTARHLKKLQEVGVVKRRLEAQKYRYSLDRQSLQSLQRSLLKVESGVSSLEETALNDEERKVLKSFFVNSRLTTIPAGRENLAILVRWFAHRFALNMRYEEAEVNRIIDQYYHDAAFFRKDMVGRGYMQRENGVYWRVN